MNREFGFLRRSRWTLKKFFGKYFFKIFFSLVIFYLCAGLYSELLTVYGEQLARGERLPYSILIFLTGAGFLFLFVLLNIWAAGRLKSLYAARQKTGWLRWVLVIVLSLAVFWLFNYSSYSLRYEGFYQRLVIYAEAVYLVAWLAAKSLQKPLEWKSSLVALILFAVLFLFMYSFRSVVDYPFGQYWSEGNRFYDYSVLYGRHLYDYPADRPLEAFIDIGRQSLWGLPFLFADINIWQMRFWYEFVFTVPYIFLGWVMLWPKREEVKFAFFFGLWTLLFLNQGPIYTPLVLAAILVAATRRSPTWLALILTAVAAYYARITRFTWVFAPAIWAALLAFIETSPRFTKTVRERWLRAILLGSGGVFGGYILPKLFETGSQVVNVQEASVELSFSGIMDMISRQPLLWNRLWPNETYTPGIVLGLLMAAGPLLALLFYFIITKKWKLDTWQKLAIFGSLSAFLVVGLVISVKIGGGSNLHNLDMFLIGLLFVAVLALDAGARDWLLNEASPWWAKALVLVAILLPVAGTMLSVKPLEYSEPQKVEEALQAARDVVENAKETGEVLFIDHRQLLTFGYIQDVPLVSEYEKKLLMDTALAEDAAYFDQFYVDLASHRYSLILTEPLYLDFQGDAYNFGNENDAWVKWVSRPVLCYYEPVVFYPEVGLMILEPKAKSAPANGIECPAP